MEHVWRIRTEKSENSSVGGYDSGVHPVMARILASRGISAAEAGPFLNPSFSAMPDPFLMLGMTEAVNRLLKARAAGENVCIYGDYDVDGISGTALLVSFLRRAGYSCRYFIPNRFDDGYGLNREALQRISEAGASLIVSVDCGITSVREAAFCREAGVDLIILDHHSPGDTLPDAAAVVNPLQPGCAYPFKSLAGVGVAFNLLVALRSRMRRDGLFSDTAEPDVREWLDLVALGTVADVVPLVDQNRLYVWYGLQRMTNSGRPGISALKKVAGIDGPVSGGQVGFRLAPRLNAAGRMESAVPGVDLLLSGDAGECGIIAGELDAANAERQALERGILEQAVAMVEKGGAYPGCRSIVLASREWHQGVIGIVASRLVERYHRPVILIAVDPEGMGKGSGRSIPGFHLLDAVRECGEFLEKFGGHRYAAGLAVAEERIARFAEQFETAARHSLNDELLQPQLMCDTFVEPSEVTLELAAELQRLAPFGSGNPEPLLVMRDVVCLDRRSVGDGHLKLRISAQGKTFDAIAFRMADAKTDGTLDIACVPESNTWNSTTRLQLRIKAIRKAETDAAY